MSTTNESKQQPSDNGDTKRTRTPLAYDSIERGALRLTLQEKVQLVKSLKAAIQDEVTNAQKVADEAGKISEGV